MSNIGQANFCAHCGNPLSATDPSTPNTTFIMVSHYAGFWKRVLAFLLDYLIIGIVSYAIGRLAILTGSLPFTETPFSPAWLGSFLGIGLAYGLIGIAISWIYYAAMESSQLQATLGKWILKLKVIGCDGNSVDFSHASARFFGKLVSGLTLGIGFFMAGFTPRRQALHDIMANCLVVTEGAEASQIQATVPAPGQRTVAAIGYFASCLFLLALMTLIGSIYGFLGQNLASGAVMPYSKFLSTVREDEIRRVIIDGRLISAERFYGDDFITYSPEDPHLINDLLKHGVEISVLPERQSKGNSLLFYVSVLFFIDVLFVGFVFGTIVQSRPSRLIG